MNNGDHITGDVKLLQNGVLFVKTDYVSSNIALDWNQVESLQTTGTYRITLNNGEKLVGRIEKLSNKSAKREDLQIHEATEDVEVAVGSVVSIETHKATFIRQLQGSIDLGYAFTSGNSQSTLNANTNAKYRAREWESAVSFDSSFNGQSGGSKTNREDLQATFTRFLNRNSFLLGLSDFLHSSQQDLSLRTTLGGGYGRFLLRTPNSHLGWIGGVVYANESFEMTASQPSAQNLEAMIGVEYQLVRFNFGELDSQLLTFPGLTDAGRVRSTTNTALTIKLINNFHLSFTFWDNFDSRPPLNAKKNELGVSSGIGWSF
jgi:putative salt-induced outer membrane protein YdiY